VLVAAIEKDDDDEVAAEVVDDETLSLVMQSADDFVWA
jgi:hypothetical protein